MNPILRDIFMRSNFINYNDKTCLWPICSCSFLYLPDVFFWWNLHTHLSFVHSRKVTLDVAYFLDSPQLLVSFVSHPTLNLKLAPSAVRMNGGVYIVQVWI